MKILIAGIRDVGGNAYNLAHAINKLTDHQAINLRAQSTYINFPCIADMGNYSMQQCRKMFYEADVIVFQSTLKPFFEGLGINKRKLKDKKNLLWCMGTEWRYGRKYLMQHTDFFLGNNHQILLGGSAMFFPGEDEEKTPCPPDAKWLPPVKSFSEISRRYNLCNQDQTALKSFATPKKKVVFCHAPTSEQKKGSPMFYRAVTQAMHALPDMSFLTIANRPWRSCLSLIAGSDVLLDQAPPFPVGYGAISIEASIFKLPVVTQIAPECIRWLKEQTGLDSPFVTFTDEEDLLAKIYRIAVDPKLRRILGTLNYKFCKAIHDEKPVVDRFLKILEEMD